MIYHVTELTYWQKAMQLGYYEPDSLHTEGFIHLSSKEQIAGVLERYYKGKLHLVLLEINVEKLKAPLKYEIAPSVNELFPHLYGRLNVDAVVNATGITGS